MPDIGHLLLQIGAFAMIWLPLLMFGLIIYLLWRTLQVMPRVKPKHVHATSKSSVSWAEVAGLEEARDEMQEIVDFLKDSKRFAKLGARVPKGILLYGPPGTGKTLLARAVARESGASFYSQSASAFVEMFAGLGAARIRKLFEQARKDAPAIVFIDELVAIARQTSGLTGADLANIANEAAIFAGRESQQHIHHIHFENAMERVIAGLQQRRVMTEKEKRILAYHEGGHALMSHLMGESFPVQKATIVPRGQALGYTFNLPQEDRYLHTREEFIDWMKIALAGRAAEQVVFGRVTNGAANDLEKVTELARSMVFEYGMSEGVVSRTMRADNYALSEETKRVRDQEQARLTDDAYDEAVRLITKHRAALDRLAQALLEKETLVRAEMMAPLSDVEPESRASETVGP